MLRLARRSLNALARLLNVVMPTPCKWVSLLYLPLAASDVDSRTIVLRARKEGTRTIQGGLLTNQTSLARRSLNTCKKHTRECNVRYGLTCHANIGEIDVS